MFALRQIIEDPQDVITVPVEFRHRPIEIIFMALESNAPDLPAHNGMTATSKTLRANWFEGYNDVSQVEISQNANGDLVIHPLPINRGMALLAVLNGFDDDFVSQLERDYQQQPVMQDRESL